MTEDMTKAMKQLHIPAVRWSERYGQWYARIGYRRSKSGRRQRSFCYFGRHGGDAPTPPAAAVALAVTKKSEWRELKRRQPIATVWPDDNAPKVRDMTEAETAEAMEAFHAETAEDALEVGKHYKVIDRATGEIYRADDGAELQTPKLRLSQVREDYLAYRKTKIGLGGDEGIKQGTYENDGRNLRLALTYVDTNAVVNGLGYREIEAWKDGIFRRVNAKAGISRRTAVNYMRSIKGMLDWAHREVRVPYRHPEDVDQLFTFRGRKSAPRDIAPYDAEQLRRLLGKATARQRLYVYLALNCGHYPVDIGRLRAEEVVTFEGLPAVVRKRDKTSHQNDFESMHYLWPETYALLKAEMARPNKYGLALLNEVGKPLYRDDAGGKYNAIGHAYYALAHAAGVTLSFKQLRKIGVSAMERLAGPGGKQARRLYKAGTIDAGDDVYVREAFENLTPYLIAWGEELRRDKVLF